MTRNQPHEYTNAKKLGFVGHSREDMHLHPLRPAAIALELVLRILRGRVNLALGADGLLGHRASALVEPAEEIVQVYLGIGAGHHSQDSHRGNSSGEEDGGAGHVASYVCVVRLLSKRLRMALVRRFISCDHRLD